MAAKRSVEGRLSRMRSSTRRKRWLIPALCWLLLPGIGVAAEGDAEVGAALAASFNKQATDDTGGGGATSYSSSIWSKLQVHGFFTQAYATASFVEGGVSNGMGSEDEIAIGIPEDGTTDYRTFALQFRYDMSEKDTFVVQLSHRALGVSPITDLEDEIELDWAFYERKISDDTSLKVGRVQIPLGIYNEIRDVGTILPFYRPPIGFYNEGIFTSETVDGFVLGHRFFAQKDWTLNFDIYAGEWDLVEFANGMVAEVRTSDSFGGQLWLNTPVSGLRFGLGAHKRTLSGGPFRPPGVESTVDEWYASVDGNFDRWTVRGEYRTFKPQINLPFGVIDLELSAWYTQVGFDITDKFQAWVQYDAKLSKESSVAFLRDVDRDFRTDLGVSLVYLFRSNIVAKLEYHEIEEEQLDLVLVFIPPGIPAIDPVVTTADNGSYTILSLSVSF